MPARRRAAEQAGAKETPCAQVTVSLVTYNGAHWLPGCLASMREQTLRPLEILIVDNASSDSTVQLLRDEMARDDRITLVESQLNVGFAKAHNRNIFAARGEFVCLLNQDVELDRRFLDEAVRPFAQDAHIGAVQGRLRRLGADGARLSVLDSTGLAMHRDRRAVSRSQGEQDGLVHSASGPVWGADGPAPVYRRVALLDARTPSSSGGWEVLDEDFFMYKEDVDLAWRLRNLGWIAWYQPSALAWHARGAGGSGAKGLLEIARAGQSIPRWVKDMSWRNQRLMQLKNDRAADFLRDFPWIAGREILSFTSMVAMEPGRLTTLATLLDYLPSTARKRRYIARARNRKISME